MTTNSLKNWNAVKDKIKEPKYRSLQFWEVVRDEIGEIIHGIEFEPNTWSSGNEVGARALILYGDVGECKLQMCIGNEPQATASVMLKNCEFLPGDYIPDPIE